MSDSLFDLDEIEPMPIFSPLPPLPTWGMNIGAGANSWAMTLGCFERGLRPDWTLFADTGSETPETYRSVEQFAAWAARAGWPFEVVQWIRQDGTFESIHENALRTGYLPSTPISTPSQSRLRMARSRPATQTRPACSRAATASRGSPVPASSKPI